MKIYFTCREIRHGIARLSQLEGSDGILMRAGNLRLGDQIELSQTEITYAKNQMDVLAVVMSGLDESQAHAARGWK